PRPSVRQAEHAGQHPHAPGAVTTRSFTAPEGPLVAFNATDVPFAPLPGAGGAMGTIVAFNATMGPSGAPGSGGGRVVGLVVGVAGRVLTADERQGGGQVLGFDQHV